MKNVVAFEESLIESINSTIKAGYVDMSIINSFIDYAVDPHPADMERAHELFEQTISKIENIPAKGGSKEMMADLMCYLVEKIQIDSCRIILLEKAYEIYKNNDNYLGRLFTASWLIEIYMGIGLRSKDESDREKAIHFLKENLAYIEKHDGRKDDYFYCIQYQLGRLCNENYQKYIPDFIVDCTPSNNDSAVSYYFDISEMIRIMYNKHISSSDPEHSYWFDAYLKYKNIEISYREKESENAMFYGLLYLGTIYSVEYSNTGNIDYYNKAKQALQKICRGKYFPEAQSKLKLLEEKFSKK